MISFHVPDNEFLSLKPPVLCRAIPGKWHKQSTAETFFLQSKHSREIYFLGCSVIAITTFFQAVIIVISPRFQLLLVMK